MFNFLIVAAVLLILLSSSNAQTKTQVATLSGGGCDVSSQVGYGNVVRLNLSLSDGVSKNYLIRDETMTLQVGGDKVVGTLSSGLLMACKGEKRTIISR